MTEYINVTVQTTEPRKISVKPNTVAPNLQITVDPTQQNAKLSRDWAIGEGLIQNEDYSSKTWAAESKSSADLSKMYSESASLDLGNLENKFTEYNTQLDETVAEGLVSLQTSVAGLDSQVQVGKTEINNVKEQAITTITAKTNDSLDTLETKTQESIERIENTSGGGSANAVTLDTEQTITGKKTYTQELRYRPDNGYKNILLGQSGQGAYGLVFESNNSAYEFVLQNQGYSASSLKVAGFNGGVKFGNTVNFNSSIYDKEGKEIKGGGGDYVAKSGDTMTGALNVPTPDYSDNSTKVATTNFIKHILANSGYGLANIVRGNDGYVDFAFGFKIRWGQVAFADGSRELSVTFPQPFATTAPKVAIFRKSGATTTTSSDEVWCRGTSSTGFDLYQKGTQAFTYMYIAVGY